jgi:hypothetical protein
MPLNDLMMANNDLGVMWRKALVAYLRQNEALAWRTGK